MNKLLKISLHVLCDTHIIKKALGIALVVGTILNLINQGDYLIKLMFGELNLFKIGLTYCVPFLVSTYTAISMKMKFHIGEHAIITTGLTCKHCHFSLHVNKNERIPECPKCTLNTHWKITKS